MVKKLEKINNSQNKNDSDLFTKSQQDKNILSEQYNFKSPIVIKETDWENITPEIANGIRSTINNDILPESIIISQQEDIIIPEQFLPFLHVDLLIKPKETSQVSGTLQYINKTFEGDYVEVLGNGATTIYQGTPYEINHLYTQDDLDDGKFDIDYTKRVYRAIIHYTYLGDEYYVDGTLSSIIVDTNVSLSPYGNQNINEWLIDFDPNYMSSKPYSKLIYLYNTNLSAHSQKLEIRWLPIEPTPPSPPYEYQENTFFDDVLIAGNFSSFDKEQFRIKSASQYKKVGVNWVFQGAGDFTIASDIHTITSKVFEFQGYWLFWDTSTSYMLGIRDVFPIVFEGDFRKKELYNLPLEPYRNWNSIVFRRFFGDHPETIETNTLATSERRFIFSKLFPNDSIQEKFRIYFNATALLLTPATAITEAEFPSYNDTYTKDATTYILSSENHTIKTKNYYRPPHEEIQYKLKISLMNLKLFGTKNNYAI